MTGTPPTVPPQPGAPEEAAAAEDEAAYGTRVEDAFLAERGTPFLLSAKDWQLVKGWRERGIPSDTVIRAVRETFEKRRARGSVGKISSIAYCAGAVEASWELERRGLVGKGEGARDVAPGEGVAPRLSRLAAAVARASEHPAPEVEPAAWAGALEKAHGAVAALDGAAGFDAVEQQLAAAEEALLKGLARALLPAGREALAARSAEALGDLSTLGSEARRRVTKAVERRELRRLLALPPLTLFDS